MDLKDLRTVLHLFAEIASSISHDEGSAAPDPDAQGREECLPAPDGEGWASSNAAQR